MRRQRLLFIAAAVLMAVLLIRWQAVLFFLGRFLVVSEQPEQADLILVLGGDFWGPRVIKGAELGTSGYAPTVLVSSPPYAGRPEGELAVEFLVKKGFRREMFSILPHNAASTIAEALVLRPELSRRKARQVILVTSNYHSRRALLVFDLFCPGVRFISAPAEQFDPHGWWEKQAARELVFSEWTKILGTVLIAYPRYLVSRI